MIKKLIKKYAHSAGGLLGIHYVQQQLVATQTALAQTQATLEQTQTALVKNQTLLAQTQAILTKLAESQDSTIIMFQEKSLLMADENSGQIQTALTKLTENKITLQDIYKAQSVAALHQKTFGAYKNAYQGKEVVLVATGPTLKDYKPITGAIHVGVNKAFTCDKFDLDVMFVQDYSFAEPYISDFCEHTNPKNPKKFLGIGSERWPNSRIPESIAMRYQLDRYYTANPEQLFEPTYDIAHQILWDSYSIAFAAMQFCLYTNPAKIYLVGCDCSSGGYFGGNSTTIYDEFTIENLINGWQKIKDFAQQYYPETEIISVNPVGLKGLFKDIS